MVAVDLEKLKKNTIERDKLNEKQLRDNEIFPEGIVPGDENIARSC